MREQTNTQKKQKALPNQKTELDLTIGNPTFMQEYWDLIAKYYNGSIGMTRIHPNENLSYNYHQTNDKLRDAIRELHKSVGNAETNGYSIVFGNGASQLISAAAYAMTGNYTDEKIAFSYNEPAWPRIPFLIWQGAAAAEGIFAPSIVPSSKIYANENVCELTVLPNNPDNSTLERPDKEGPHKIYDLCYNWPQYTKVAKYNGQIMIFGIAKATGHAGTRFGWALVKNPDTAEAMRKYIELTTSGVSEDAQARAYIVIDTIARLRKEEFTDCFSAAAADLKNRWAQFLNNTTGNGDFLVTNHNGMFAWCKMTGNASLSEISEKLGIKVMHGALFGEAFGDFFRLSMGGSKNDFGTFIKRLSETYGTATKKP